MKRFLSVRFTAACARMFLLITSLPISLQLEPCGSFGGLKEKNFVLPGYTFDSSYTGDSLSCADRCFSHEQCKSYNFALSGPQQGSCELNSVGRFAALRPLQYRPDFVFVDIVTRKPVSTSSSCWVISSVLVGWWSTWWSQACAGFTSFFAIHMPNWTKYRMSHSKILK